ncbi:MAG: dephospho-CoA kinase [Bacteroidales bacterium]|nr:dephospho-CoA kinase [Bacteroidales bacterium]
MHPKTVIVTGLIGSGKSAVCAQFAAQGIPVYSCDERTKSLYNRSPELVSRLEQALGKTLRGADGHLDRGALAGAVFSDGNARRQVEDMVYPLVLQRFKRWRARQKGSPLVALESAVILSKPIFDGLADAVVLVTAPEDLRLARVMERDGLSESAVRARMAAQADIPASAASFIIENDGSPGSLEKAVKRIIKTLQI